MRLRSTPPGPGHGGRLGHSAARLVTAVVLGFASVIVVVPSVASAAGAITLDKSSSGSVLLGGAADFTLTASNPAAPPIQQYNLSYSDTLPPGVTYVPGSTSPSSFGEPDVFTAQVLVDGKPYDQQTLVWSNVADLTPGASTALSFSATVPAVLYPIGSTLTNDGSAFTSSDPREVPEFDGKGQWVPGSETVSASDSADTTVTAIKISKAVGVAGEGTPEGELLRGVNDHQTVYALTVTNNVVGGTTDVLVADYIPAGMEFLGCGGDDFNSKPEYPGASNKVNVVSGCAKPTSVETVESPFGYPAGVYTRVTWKIADLAPGDKRVLRYGAGIPQRSNTMDFAGGTPATDGAQAANLNNNTGASTVETESELALKNFATVVGAFDGKDVGDVATATVTAEDLRIVKSVSPTNFVQDGIATYRLVVDTSEYANADGLVITDEMPAGLCPLRWSDPNYKPAIAECDTTQGADPTNAAMSGVIQNIDGSFNLTFTPDATSLDANGHVVITYQALMRRSYDTRASGPTSAQDTFTNHVKITGETTPPEEVQAPDTSTQKVSDTSSATIRSEGPQLTKLRMPNASPMTCSKDVGDYADSFTDENPFTEGDRVCFLLQVTFPEGVDTRNAELTDFLPNNLTYESSMVLSGAGLVSGQSPASPTNYVTLTLGTGDPRVVPRGSVFDLVVSAIVTKPPVLSSPPKALDKQNLAKFRYTNTGGESESLRSSVSLPLGPPPPIGITKGVQSVNAKVIDDGSTPGNVDGSTVRGGDKVTFRVDLQNLSKPGEINADPIGSPDVWDVLPTGIDCAAISAISDSGACYNAGDPSRPNVKGDSTSSVIRWQLPAGYVLNPQAFGKLTYTMAIPTTVSVSARFDNTVAVASYRSATNIGDGKGAVHNPANNVDADVPIAQVDVPPARDISYVVVPDTVLTKANVTDITEVGNNASQAVIGETITYTISGRLPARTSVYNGVLVDPMPAGIVFVGPATAFFSATGTAPAADPLPTGVTLNPGDGRLSFGAAYTNASNTDQLFEVRIPGRMDTASGNTHGTTLTNTATFTSDTAETGGTPITPRSATSDVTVVEPQPTLAKTRVPSAASVAGGTTLTYTLTATNAAGRPPLHDTVVVDCVPTGLTVGTITPTNPAVTVVPGGCAAGAGTSITWAVGDLAGGATKQLAYPATITGAAGGQSYTNNATLTGSSLADGSNGTANERVYTGSGSQVVKVIGATVTKAATPTSLTIGQRGSWTVTVTLPANLDFYDSIVTDAIPAGFTVTGLTTDAVSCTGFATCPTLTTLTSSPPVPANGVAATVGWGVGDIAASGSARTITITYSATVADVAANAPGPPQGTRPATPRPTPPPTVGTSPTRAAPRAPPRPPSTRPARVPRRCGSSSPAWWWASRSATPHPTRARTSPTRWSRPTTAGSRAT
jgi:large repetitive protein